MTLLRGGNPGYRVGVTAAFDTKTLRFYEREASPYAAASRVSLDLAPFLARLAPGARILELGCGGGHDAEMMQSSGFDVTATDGTAALAAEAQRRLGREVRVMRFDELTAEAEFDAVWANACLLHVPLEALGETLRRVWLALRPEGLFFASFKAGLEAGLEGGRDGLGRYYNFPDTDTLARAYQVAGDWSQLEMTSHAGGGYDGVPRNWLNCLCRKQGETQAAKDPA